MNLFNTRTTGLHLVVGQAGLLVPLVLLLVFTLILLATATGPRLITNTNGNDSWVTVATVPRVLNWDTWGIPKPSLFFVTANTTVNLTTMVDRLGNSVVTSSSSSSSSSSIHDDGVVNCSTLLQEVTQGTRWDPNQGELFLRYTKLYPQFWISVHNFAFDKVRYGTLHWGKYYEKALSKAFVHILDTQENSLVIDVGGNIGWFSLLSAAMGHEVHVFEPNVVNVHRMCESICVNGWERCDTTLGSLYTVDESKGGSIQIRTLGLNDEAGEFGLMQDPKSFSNGAAKLVTMQSEGSTPVRVVTLDQMALKLGWMKRDIAILKVDVEGLEHAVFEGGRRLLESGKVHNVFMEGNLATKIQEEQFTNLSRTLIHTGYLVHKLGGSIGPANDVDTLPTTDQTQSNFLSSLVYGCRGYKQQNRHQCNIWWKLSVQNKRINGS